MKKFVVLDVEGAFICRPYNVGYVVTDKHGNIYHSRSVAIHPCIMENLQRKALVDCEEMTHKNISEVESDCMRKYEHFFSIEEFHKVFMNDMEKFGIKTIWAYNCTFDKGAMKRLFLDCDENFTEKFEWLDIMTAILFTKLLTKKYVKFCRKNGFVTEKGNIQTKAEVVYRYLTGNVEFVEEHTGLADVMIEKEILVNAYKTRKKIRGEVVVPWKRLRDFCEENSI